MGDAVTPDQQDRLREILATQAVIRRPIVLSSGKPASYYVDGRLVTLSPEGAYLTALAILDALRDVEVDAVGGPTVGADPIAGAVAAVSAQVCRPLAGFIARKETKSHGTGRLVEGPVAPGMKVAVVDDTATSGTSLFQAIDAVEGIGCTVVAVIALVDRLEGARERLAQRGYDYRPLFTI